MHPLPLLAGMSPASVHAPPLAEETRCWCARRLPGIARAAVALRRCSRWPPAMRSNRAWWCARPSGWTLRHGPLPRRALPPLKQPGWTLLVQGLDLHLAAAHELLSRFRFVPDARLDDLMLSYASDGGGVGPHLDSYDVFLIQVQGRRRWRVGRARDPQLRARPAAEDPAPLRARARLAARTRRHALPAAAAGHTTAWRWASA